jgi:hypothetical protein
MDEVEWMVKASRGERDLLSARLFSSELVRNTVARDGCVRYFSPFFSSFFFLVRSEKISSSAAGSCDDLKASQNV